MLEFCTDCRNTKNMNVPNYPAARFAAERVHSVFAIHHKAAKPGSKVAALPDLAEIESMIDVAFWTSLRREEQKPPRISLAYVSPEDSAPSLQLERPLALVPATLTKIAPGAERPGIHLGVWKSDGILKVWGATRNIPNLCFTVEAVAPGLLVVKHRRDHEGAKFVNVAVLEGEQVKILNHEFSSFPRCPSVVGSMLGLDSLNIRAAETSGVLIRLAISMRAHGRGGALLVVPKGSSEWQDSLVKPINYRISPPYPGLTKLMHESPADEDFRRWSDALARVVDGVAGLTAIDGATVVSDDGEVLAFGGKIIRKSEATFEQVWITEPVEGSEAISLKPTYLGGTRHLSAAQFCFDQRNAMAMVASQDGPFTIFSWSECDNALYGHRVESLLL
jgi:hypothetical protein